MRFFWKRRAILTHRYMPTRKQNPTAQQTGKPRVLKHAVNLLLEGLVLVSISLCIGAEAAPLAPSGPVPLGQFTHAETRGWSSVPRGTQTVDNVTFVCDGAIRTAGLTSIWAAKDYPGAFVEVPVGRSGSKIHLLQASENKGGMREFLPYGRVVFRYANGETRQLDLLFGVHGRDWMSTVRAFEEPILDPNSRLGYTHKSRSGVVVRFYHTIITNPLPKIPIVSADFISTLQKANLLLFGLTLDNDPAPLEPPYPVTEKIPPNPVIFQVQDERGKPMRNARVAWVGMSREPVHFPAFPLDQRGEVKFDIPLRALESIHYTATAPGGLSASGDLSADESGRFPGQVSIQLKNRTGQK
jgi:hypothetical protein